MVTKRPNSYTNQESDYICQNVKLDELNRVINAKELSNALNISKQRVQRLIRKLRLQNRLPNYRGEKANHFSQHEIDYLIENIWVNPQNGMIQNIDLLAEDLKRTKECVTRKLVDLRKKGIIEPTVIRNQKLTVHQKNIFQKEYDGRKTSREMAQLMECTIHQVDHHIKLLRESDQFHFGKKYHENKWDKKEIAFLLSKTKLDEKGCLRNGKYLAEKLNRSLGSIKAKVSKLRVEGQLPRCTRNDDSARKMNYRYTSEEEKLIAELYNSGTITKDIAEIMDRSFHSVKHRITKLKSENRLNDKIAYWSEEEELALKNSLEYDTFMCVKNWPEVFETFSYRSQIAIEARVLLLKKRGIVPKALGPSEKSRESFKILNSRLWVSILGKRYTPK